MAPTVRHCYAISIIAAISCVISLVIAVPSSQSDLYSSPMHRLTGSISQLQQALLTSLTKGVFTTNDFDKLNFAYPCDDTYVTHSQRPLVFDSQELIKAFPIAQPILNEVTTVKGTRVVFNLYRDVYSDGHRYDTLWAIVPNMKSSICAEHAQGEFGIGNYTLDQPLTLQPDNTKIASSSPGFPLLSTAFCIRGPNQDPFYFSRLLRRRVEETK